MRCGNTFVYILECLSKVGYIWGSVSPVGPIVRPHAQRTVDNARQALYHPKPGSVRLQDCKLINRKLTGRQDRGWPKLTLSKASLWLVTFG